MQDGTIKDSQITALSTYPSDGNHDYFPHFARLHKQTVGRSLGGWASGNLGIHDFIQVDLGSKKVITMVATQGRSDPAKQFVTAYSLSYSDDGANWKKYEEDCPKVRIL